MHKFIRISSRLLVVIVLLLCFIPFGTYALPIDIKYVDTIFNAVLLAFVVLYISLMVYVLFSTISMRKK